MRVGAWELGFTLGVERFGLLLQLFFIHSIPVLRLRYHVLRSRVRKEID
jgi:hypothetical protein